MNKLKKFDDFDANEWGNTSLPGFTHEELMDPNLNYVLANLARNKDPNWIAKQEKIYKSPRFKKLISKITKEKWSNAEFQSKQHTARILAWADADERRKKVSEWASESKTKNHKKNISKAIKKFNQTPEGKALIKARNEAQRGKPKRKFTCPHCKEIGGPVIKRWHFDNCKKK